MMRIPTWISNGVALGLIAAVLGVIAHTNSRARQQSPLPTTARPAGVRGGPSTTREELRLTIAQMESTLRGHPTDAKAAVQLSDALLRQARVSANAGLARSAEEALGRVLADEPGQYEARRMLATVYLSEHRFRDAIREAEHARDQQPGDSWNYAVIGDGHVELGEYDAAFSAFERMMDLRPNAAAYARAAYALELRGHLGAALDAMKLATDATSPRDVESLAWHHSQLGELYWQMGRLADAAHEYHWADYVFPGHPFAQHGLAKVKEAAGDLAGAVAIYKELMSSAPAPDIAAKLGELLDVLGRPADAARYYALAETGWRVDVPQPAMLARFLAEHDRHPDEAVALAELAAADRHDIFTEDSLAWAYFKVGRLTDAAAASTRALRLGAKDRTILYHAAAIRQGLGDHVGAHRLAAQALAGHPRFDVRLAPAARSLLEGSDEPVRVAVAR
jgi:tetratricopeptide (TPR) repeat protein